MESSAMKIEGQVRSSSSGIVYYTLALVAMIGLIPLGLGKISPLAYLGLLAVLAALGLFVINIRYFLIAYLGLRALMEYLPDTTTVNVGSFSFQVVGFLGLAITIGGLVYIISNRVKIYEVSVLGPILVFLAVTLPTLLLFSSSKMDGFKDWTATASAVVLFPLVIAVFKKKDIPLLLGTLFAPLIPILLIGFYQLATDTGNHQTAGFNRIEACFVHPNSYALYLVVMILICMPLITELKPYWQRITVFGVCIAMFVSLIFTYSRVSWFTLLAGLLILGVFRYRWLLAAIPAAVVGVVLFVPSIIERMQEVTGFSQGQGSMFFRVEMWKYLLPHFYQNPVIGNGLGSFVDYIEEGMGYFYLPHNDYVRLLVDTGIIGLVSFIGAIVFMLIGSARTYALADDKDKWTKMLSLVVVSILVVYLLGSFTDNLFRLGFMQTYIWMLAAMVAIASREIIAGKAAATGNASSGERSRPPSGSAESSS